MKRSNKLRGMLAILLAAAMLPGCSSGAGNPADALGASGDASAESSDAAEKTAFRSLTDAEAEALFGKAEPRTLSNVDDGWHYFLAGFSNGNTIYRYHYDTGEIEFACGRPGCDHTDDIDWGESSCPLYQKRGSDLPNNISVMNGKLIYMDCGSTTFHYDEEGNVQFDEDGRILMETEDATLLWYDRQTNESRVFAVAAPYDVMACYRVGDCFYYDRSVYVRESDTTHHELWRVDEAGSEPMMVVTGHEGDYTILPYRQGEETIYLDYSYLSLEGRSPTPMDGSIGSTRRPANTASFTSMAFPLPG